MSTEDLVPEITVDATLLPEQINLNTFKDLEQLAPFGQGFPEPLFLTKNVRAELFVFSTCMNSVVGLNYFNTKLLKDVHEPMCVSKTGQMHKCFLLATKIKGDENFYLRLLLIISVLL